MISSKCDLSRSLRHELFGRHAKEKRALKCSHFLRVNSSWIKVRAPHSRPTRFQLAVRESASGRLLLMGTDSGDVDDCSSQGCGVSTVSVLRGEVDFVMRVFFACGACYGCTNCAHEHAHHARVVTGLRRYLSRSA